MAKFSVEKKFATFGTTPVKHKNGAKSALNRAEISNNYGRSVELLGANQYFLCVK